MKRELIAEEFRLFSSGIVKFKEIVMKVTLLYLLVALALLTGCVSIPPEAPELSSELGKRIAEIEKSNITLLHRFFDQKRAEVDRFIEEEWVPQLADNFFAKQRIKDTWDIIVEENNAQDRLRFIVTVGPKLQEEINSKRLELIQPLDLLERRIEGSIRGEYQQAYAINNTITSFLISASEVSENRNRYLESVGISDDDVGDLIDKTDDAVTDLLGGAINGQGKIESAEKYIEKIREIRDSIN